MNVATAPPVGRFSCVPDLPMGNCGDSAEGRAPGPEGGQRGTAVTAFQLLGGNIDDPVRPSEIQVPLEMVADLYAYPLIITPDYVGADRRVPAARHRRDRGGADRPPDRLRSWSPWW